MHSPTYLFHVATHRLSVIFPSPPVLSSSCVWFSNLGHNILLLATYTRSPSPSSSLLSALPRTRTRSLLFWQRAFFLRSRAREGTTGVPLVLRWFRFFVWKLLRTTFVLWIVMCHRSLLFWQRAFFFNREPEKEPRVFLSSFVSFVFSCETCYVRLLFFEVYWVIVRSSACAWDALCVYDDDTWVRYDIYFRYFSCTLHYYCFWWLQWSMSGIQRTNISILIIVTSTSSSSNE